jgi:ABC-type lipoprotein export system ATPase subunit
MLHVHDLEFRYTSGESGLVVKDWRVEAGQSVAIVGPSGAGKTTLLKLIGGIHRPQVGAVEFDGVRVNSLPEGAQRAWRLSQVGVVFQDFALLDYLTVEENLLLPVQLNGRETAAHRVKARELADRLEVGRYWGKRSAELSQGERQRVAIARALVHGPALVLADEPTASLDSARKMTAAHLVLEEGKARKAVVLMVTHDPDLLPLFDRVVPLEDLAR